MSPTTSTALSELTRGLGGLQTINRPSRRSTRATIAHSSIEKVGELVKSSQSNVRGISYQCVLRSSEPDTSVLYPGPALLISATTSHASIRMPRRSPRFSAVIFRFSTPTSIDLFRATPKTGGSISPPILQSQYARPTPCLSQSEPHRDAVTVTPI